MDSQQELHDLLGQLGEFGRYQFTQHTLHSLAWFLAAVHMMSFVFVFPTLDHRCRVEHLDGYNFNESGGLSELEFYIPKNSKGDFESCFKYNVSDESNGTIPCDTGYVYYSEYFSTSRITDWAMVCDRRWMRALLQSIFLFGTLTGAFLCGYVADKFGRKPIFCISGIIQCVCGVAGVFLNNYLIFALAMFFYGLFGGSGSVVPSVALTMEIVGPSKRNMCGTMFTVWFGLGAIVVASWAYFLPINARYLQLIYALHSILLFGHSWFMDESICWLWSHGRRKEALKIAERAAKINGRKFENRYSTTPPQNNGVLHLNSTSETALASTEASKKVSTFDLFRYPKLRQRTVVMLFCWFACNLTYFGLSFNSVNLFGNPILMFVINILVEVPGHIISIFVTAKTGNKPMFFLSMLITGVGCVCVALLPLGILSTCVSMLSKVTATVCFNVINGYTAELFPTSLRNTAIGLCVMAARSGASIIPEINLLSSASEGIPTITFGTVGIIASLLVLAILPETMNKEMPQTIEDVEKSEKVESSNSVGIFSWCFMTSASNHHEPQA